MKRALLLLLLAQLVAWPAQGRELQLMYEGSDAESGRVRFLGAGEVFDIQSLHEVSFALEYDPDRFEITEITPGGFLLRNTPDSLQIIHETGRVRVFAGFDEPAPITGIDWGDVLFGVSSTLVDELYDGEKLRIRLVGFDPGAPPIWIDDPQNPDDIKVIAGDRVIVGDSGITCLAGDALGDGELDAGDAGAVLRIAAGLVEAPDVHVRCGSDFNRDGYIQAGDGVLILRRAAGFDAVNRRVAVGPGIFITPTANGARVRVTGADFAHGATLRLRTVGGLALRDIETTSTGLTARRVDEAEAVLALADATPLTDDVLEFDIEVEGVGRLVVEQLSLFGADGAAWFDQPDPLSLELSGAAPMPRVALLASPNPFNPSTTFWMELPREGRVTLELFDMRGRRVAMLLDELRPAGRSDHRFDAGPMPSGVYFARMSSVSGTTVTRVTLLK
jgi:hypothetical protein